MFFGACFLIVIYLLLTILSLKKKQQVIDKYDENFTKEDIDFIIKKQQTLFLKRKKEQAVSIALKETIIEMINQIASKFYPDSKHPIAELTLDELLVLIDYIRKTIDRIFSRKGLKLLRKLKVSTILNIIDKKNTIVETKAFKASKKMHLPKIIKGVTLALNAINPFHWFKRLVVSPSLNLIIKKSFLELISYIGEETYSIYSKKLFVNKDNEAEIEKMLIEELDKENEKIYSIAQEDSSK